MEPQTLTNIAPWVHGAFTLNLHKVYLHVAVENEKAIHLYEECGFVEEGHLVKEIFINGKYCDIKRMYILQDEYFLSRNK
ncbi:spermidine N1-acetyltransferase [Photobacterium sp. SKA34]|nr:spermidine N1-acetyltransferase [Photobacterium sp. SKA34]